MLVVGERAKTRGISLFSDRRSPRWVSGSPRADGARNGTKAGAVLHKAGAVLHEALLVATHDEIGNQLNVSPARVEAKSAGAGVCELKQDHACV